MVCNHPTTANNVPPAMPRIVRTKTPNLTGRQQQNVRVRTVADMIIVFNYRQGRFLVKELEKGCERTRKIKERMLEGPA